MYLKVASVLLDILKIKLDLTDKNFKSSWKYLKYLPQICTSL